MTETRSKNAANANNNVIELLKLQHENEIDRLHEKIKFIKKYKQDNQRGVLLFIYAMSLLATFAWKYGNTKAAAKLLRASNFDKFITPLDTNFATYNILDLSIATALYHYIVFHLIRFRAYVTCASLVMAIGSVPLLF